MVLNGDRVSVLQDEKHSGMDGGDGYTSMSIYPTPLNCTLKNGENGKLCYMYFIPVLKYILTHVF